MHYAVLKRTYHIFCKALYASGLIYVCLMILSTFTLAQQGVKQSGRVTPGHASTWTTNGVIGDAGTSAQGLLSSIGVTASGPGICQNSGPVSGPYNQICLSTTQTGGGQLSLWNRNGATGGLSLVLNGNVQGLPTVTVPTTPGGFTCFLNTSGQLGNCTVGANPVFGPVSSTATNFAVFADGTGALLANGPSQTGGITATMLASGAASTNIGALGGVLGGTLPNPTMAAGAAATNIGTLGGVLTGTLPNPGLGATPTVFGGAAAGSTLTLESTSGTGTTDFISFKTGSQVERLRVGNTASAAITSSGTASGLTITQTGTGTGSGHYSIFPPAGQTLVFATANAYVYNYENITDDILTTDGAFVIGHYVSQFLNTAGFIGGRETFAASLTINAASDPSNPIPEYVGGIFTAVTMVDDNGTGGSPRGDLFAGNFVAGTGSGGSATHWHLVAGMEVDTFISTGTAAQYRYGVSIISVTQNQVVGSVDDAALHIGIQGGTLAWKNGISIDANSTSDNILLSTPTQITGAGHISTQGGLELGGPSGGIEGNGTVNAKTGYYLDGNAGVDCLAGVTAGTVVVHKGIVTHC